MTTELLERPNTTAKAPATKPAFGAEHFPAKIFEFQKLQQQAELATSGRTYNDYVAAVGYMTRLRRAAWATNQEERFDDILAEFKSRHRFKVTLIKLLNSKVEAFSV